MFFLPSSMEEEPDDQPDASSVAVLDNQYTGFGDCTDDVAYILFSDALGDLMPYEEESLDCYHEELVEQLMVHGRVGPSMLSMENIQILLNLSRLDMTRHWMNKRRAASTPGN